MTKTRFVLRGLRYYWRTNLAVVLGVATAVAVLAGALLVGDSVRASLRDLVLGRLGRTDYVVASTTFFREPLAAELAADPAFAGAFAGVTPLIVAPGFATAQESGRRAPQVRVSGVDNRFWRFHGLDGGGPGGGLGAVSGPGNRDAFISPALAAHLGVGDGSAILVRLQRPTDLPIESLFAHKDDLGRTLRLTVRAVLTPATLGEFSLEAQQGDVRAVFVPLSRLQQELELPARVNALIVSAGAAALTAAQAAAPPPDTADRLEQLVRRHAQLEDLGLTITTIDARRAIAVGSVGGVLDDTQAAATQSGVVAGDMEAQPVFTYLANSLRVGDREVPYSLVTAMDLGAIAPGLVTVGDTSGPGVPDGAAALNDPRARLLPPLVLNQWAATDLRASVGDSLTLSYFVWVDPGKLVTDTALFRVAAVVPTGAGDRDLAPAFPGISDSPTLDDWDPPFPVDLARVRRVDEEYWAQYRTTPKAFIPLEVGQRLWGTRYGSMTSMRMTPPEGQSLAEARDQYVTRLRGALDPLAMGLAVRDVRAEGVGASRGATDFGAYFLYFSFFLVVSALLLVSLFFKLGVEQRAREVGLLRAVGLGPAAVRRLFLAEGLVLSVIGSGVGVLGALAYAAVIMEGLRSWWVDAVGTTALTLHVTMTSLVSGAAGGVVSAAVCIWWTLRSLDRLSERSLLAGQLASDEWPAGADATQTRGQRRRLIVTVALVAVGVGLLGSAVAGWTAREGGFFGAGGAFLVASLNGASFLLRRRMASGGTFRGRGWRPVSGLGVRNATYRPGRSVLSIAVIACATFILVSVDAFRRGDGLTDQGPGSGVGGYALLVETLLPVVHDPNAPEGREALNLTALDPSVRIEPLRLRPGDDASCLNLYEPRNPRILAPRDSFLAEGRFAFQDSLASTDAERANPWLLLKRVEADGAIPVIADANSMAYVLHRGLGEDIVLGDGTVRLRLVAALRDSLFQGELLMSQDQFVRAFPEEEGARVLLVESPHALAAATAVALEDGLADLGAEAVGTAAKLAQFHRVENTYLSTFQALGGLGLLLGTVGLATVLLRNVLERRRELALLGAVGYRPRHVLLMILAEHALLLGGGLAAGALCAALAIGPAVAERGGRVPLTASGVALLVAVCLTGLVSSIVATRVVARAPLLTSLRSE